MDPLAYRNLGTFNMSGLATGRTITGAVAIDYATLTITNPAGAPALIIVGGSAYAYAAGGVLDFYIQIDGDNWANRHVGHFYFNVGNAHRWCGTYTYVTPELAAGAHSIGYILNPVNQWIIQDGTYDWNTFVGVELP